MTATTAFLYAIFWLLIAAILGGIIVYLLMRNRMKRLSEMEENYAKLEKEFQTKQKDFQLEISAREKKISSLNDQLKECQSKNNAFILTISQKDAEIANLLTEYDGFKASTIDQQTKLSASLAEQESQIERLKAEYTGFRTNFEAHNKEISMSEEEKEQLLETLGTMRGELEILKGNFIIGQQEMLKITAERDALLSAKADLEATLQEQQGEMQRVIGERDVLLSNKATLEIANQECQGEKLLILAQLNAEKEKQNKTSQTEQTHIVQTAMSDEAKIDNKKEFALAKVREKAKDFDYSNMGIATYEEKDDLKIIVGIGPFIEEKLNALGIYTFLQISRFNDNDVEQVTKAIEFFPGRIQRDGWISQAAELAKK
jgi:predicted flap endonuclease-1-like 5' DNA nuclease